MALCPLDCMQRYSSTDSRLPLYLLVLFLIFRFARGRSGWEGGAREGTFAAQTPFHFRCLE